MTRVRTLIADDTGLLRRLLAQQLSREADIEIVGEAADGREAIDLARTSRPDVVLLDLDMPVLNGIQAAQRIAANQPGVGIVLLTGHEQLAQLGRLSGASECLDKRCTPEELAQAIRRAAAARRAAPERSNGSRDVQAILGRLTAQYALTARERTVVDRMVTTEMTAAQMARAMSDEEGVPMTESAVKHALDRALNKMGVEPRTRAALIRRVLDSNTTLTESSL